MKVLVSFELVGIDNEPPSKHGIIKVYFTLETEICFSLGTSKLVKAINDAARKKEVGNLRNF